MTSLSNWLPTYSWHIVFVLVLFLTVCVPFFLLSRRLKAILGQQNLWRDLEQSIAEVTPKACQYYPNPSRHVLMSVLTQEKGVVQAGTVGPALDYLAAELDSPISIIRSLSYLSILVGLLGTVSLLALALQSVDAIGQFRIDQLKNIYPLNAIAIGLAVLIFLSYSWWRHQSDQFILHVSRVLAKLRTDQIGPADPALLATLEKVGEKFKTWGNEIHEKHRQEINHLVQEVKELSESIRQVIVTAIAARQEDDRALVPLLHSQDAKLELLHQRLYQNYLLLSQNSGSPENLSQENSGVIGAVKNSNTAREPRNRKKNGFLSRYFK
jgi:uncharacterized protein YoxC